MKKTDAERKLALVQSIRMENQYNRMKCREREHILYGTAIEPEKGELYGAEIAAGLAGYGMEDAPSKENFLGGFRIRFLLAAALYGCKPSGYLREDHRGSAHGYKRNYGAWAGKFI